MSDLKGTDCQMIVSQMQGSVHSNRDYLSKLDAAIGDGDHGVNLDNALQEANVAVTALNEPSPFQVFALVGTTLQNEMGGAAGIIFGAFFTGGSRAVRDKPALDIEEMVSFFEAGIATVQKRGKAEAGDKTILDTLLPAFDVLKTALADGASLETAFPLAATAAQDGAASTSQMIARHGRAKFLGDRSLGHQDAGATSMALMLTAWACVFDEQ